MFGICTCTWIQPSPRTHRLSAVTRLAYNQFRIITQLHPYLDKGSLRTFVLGGLTGNMEFPLRLGWRLQWLQNLVARLVAGVGKFDHITLVLACLHWLSLPSQVKFKALVLTYKCLRCLGPYYLVMCLFPRSSTHASRST